MSSHKYSMPGFSRAAHSRQALGKGPLALIQKESP